MTTRVAIFLRGASVASALVGACPLGACHQDDGADRAEAAALVDAIRAVRAAAHDAKAAPLERLRALRVDGDAIELRRRCVEAYELHVGALARMGEARESLGTGVAPMTAKSVELLGQAQRDLERSVEIARDCADAEADLVRRYHLE